MSTTTPYIETSIQRELDTLRTVPSKGTRHATAPLWGCLLRIASLAKTGQLTYEATAARVASVGNGRPIGDRLNDVERQFRNAWRKANPRIIQPSALALSPRRGSR